MKLTRYGRLGEEKPGIIDLDGNMRDLSKIIDDIDASLLNNDLLIHKLTHVNPNDLPLVDPSMRLGACIKPGKLICIGFNSKLHNQQLGMIPATHKDITVFMKPTCCICGANDPILYTKNMKKLDWEAELGVIIAKKGKYIPFDKAMDYVFGYACINDLSERYWQFEMNDTQFTKGKCFDNSAPIGPYLVSKDEINDASNLQIQLWINDVLRQDFNTQEYIHDVKEIISYLSQFFTLYPGDVISMGSAPGNALSWGDEFFLKPKDKVILNITGLGMQQQIVIDESI